MRLPFTVIKGRQISLLLLGGTGGMSSDISVLLISHLNYCTHKKSCYYQIVRNNKALLKNAVC